MDRFRTQLIKYIQNNLDKKNRWQVYKSKVSKNKKLKHVKSQAVDPIIVLSYFNEPELLEEVLENKRLKPNKQDNLALRWATYLGHEHIVKILLNDPRVDPSDHYNEAIITASTYGYTRIAEMLLEDPRVDPTDDYLLNSAIVEAHEHEYFDIYHLLFETQNIDVDSKLICAVDVGDLKKCKQLLKTGDPNLVIVSAIENSHIYIIQELLKHQGLDLTEINLFEILVQYLSRYDLGWLEISKHQNWDIVRLLLKDNRCDPSCSNNILIIGASRCNHLDIVKELMKDNRVNPSDQDNYALYLSCLLDQTGLARELMKDPRTSPNGTYPDRSDSALYISSYFNNPDIIKILLKHPAVDVNCALFGAVCGNRIELVQKLVKDYEIDLSINDNYLIDKAVREGYVEIVQILADDDRVDCTSVIKTCLIWGKYNIFKILMEKVDPSIENQELLRLACTLKKYMITGLLLKDPRVNPTINRQEPLRVACKRGYYGIVKLLLKDPRVNPSVMDNYCLRWASRKGYSRIVKLLLDHNKTKVIFHSKCDYEWALQNWEIAEMMVYSSDNRENIDQRIVDQYYSSRKLKDLELGKELNMYLINDIIGLVLDYEP